MKGLPQSRPWENDQSRVAMSPAAPARRARSTRAAISSRVPIQYSWKKVFGLAARPSSIGLLAIDDRPIAVPRAAAARATATSPSGCTACTPVGLISTGSETSWPITVVPIRLSPASPAVCGAKPISSNAAMLSAAVRPFSAPGTSAPYTPLGSRRLARRCASATVSNQGFAIAVIVALSATGSSRAGGPEGGEGAGQLGERGVQVVGQPRPPVGEPDLEGGGRGRPRRRRDEAGEQVVGPATSTPRHVLGHCAVDLGVAQLGVGEQGRLAEDQPHPLAQHRQVG